MMTIFFTIIAFALTTLPSLYKEKMVMWWWTIDAEEDNDGEQSKMKVYLT